MTLAAPARLPPRSADAIAVRLVAWVRVLVAVGAAAAGSFLPHVAGRHAAVFLVLGLAWVPWSTVVLFAADQPDNQLAVKGGPAGDLVVLFVVQALVPAAGQAILIGYLVVVAFAVYSAGRPFATLLGALAIGLAGLAEPFADSGHRLGLGSLVPFSAAVVALVFLFERTATLQARAAARYQQLQSRSDSILAHVADAVVVTDSAGRVLECNPAALRLAGREGGALVGLGCDEALGLHRGERALDCRHGCPLLTGDTADAALGEELWRGQPGERRQPLLATATEVPIPGGGTEVVHSLRDVTRLKQAEEAKNLFLATASHELKTPLTVIKGFADTLARYSELDEETRDMALEAIQVRAAELSVIVDRLLLSSRIEAGSVNLARRETDVGAVLDERVHAMAAATGRHVELSIDAGLPTAWANHDALVTVVDHLVDNALKYSPEGETVEVNARAAPVAGEVVVEVNDHGIGMDAEQAAHCFDKFWQAESTDVRRFGGTGIGLYIVKSLVEAMGGHIEVASRPFDGTRFSIYLVEAEAAAAAAAATAAARATGAAAEDRALAPATVGEPTSIREFMRQIGVPERQT